MVNLTFLFFFITVLFAVIGSLRGWAKELLVTFSIILAIFIISILQSLIPDLLKEFTPSGTQAYFWLRAIIIIILVFFGYQTPNIPKIGGVRFARERLQDVLLGFFLGAMNGFLMAGAMWYYMKEANYPFHNYILPPNPEDPFTASAVRLLPWLAPAWLRGNMLFLAIALAFVFLIVVFI